MLSRYTTENLGHQLDCWFQEAMIHWCLEMKTLHSLELCLATERTALCIAQSPPWSWRTAPPQVPMGTSTGHHPATWANEPSYRERDHTDREHHPGRTHGTVLKSNSFIQNLLQLYWGPQKIREPKSPLVSRAPLENRAPLTCAKLAAQGLSRNKTDFQGSERQPNPPPFHRGHPIPSKSLVSHVKHRG